MQKSRQHISMRSSELDTGASSCSPLISERAVVLVATHVNHFIGGKRGHRKLMHQCAAASPQSLRTLRQPFHGYPYFRLTAAPLLTSRYLTYPVTWNALSSLPSAHSNAGLA